MRSLNANDHQARKDNLLEVAHELLNDDECGPQAIRYDTCLGEHSIELDLRKRGVRFHPLVRYSIPSKEDALKSVGSQKDLRAAVESADWSQHQPSFKLSHSDVQFLNESDPTGSRGSEFWQQPRDSEAFSTRDGLLFFRSVRALPGVVKFSRTISGEALAQPFEVPIVDARLIYMAEELAEELPTTGTSE